MFILINIGLVFLTAFLFSTSFFVIEATKSTDFVIRMGINKLLTEMITGIIYSGLFILLQMIMNSIFDKFNIQIFLMGFVVLIVILNYRIALFSLSFALIYFLLSSPIDTITYVEVISFMLMGIIYLIIDYFFKGLGSKILFYVIGSIVGLFAFLVMGIGFGNGMTISVFSEAMLPLLLLPILDYSIRYVIRVSQEANILYDSINFVFGKFHREAIKDQVIGQMIVDKKVKQGIYAVLKIDFKYESKENINALRNSILTNLQNAMPSEAILFHNGGDNYGFFIPTNFDYKIKSSIENNTKIKRPKEDPISFLENYISKPSKKYVVEKDKAIQVEIFGGVSLYGLQSNSIVELNKEAEFALKINKKLKSNRITIFDPVLLREKVKDSYSIQALDKLIGLDNFANRFAPIVNMESGEVDYQYNFQISVSESEFIQDVKMYIKDLEASYTFERYYAIDALKKANDYSGDLIIEYSLEIFNDNFIIEEFLRQINTSQIDKSKLIFLSKFENISKLKETATIKKTMRILRKEGIRFAIDSLNKTKFDFDLFIIKNKDILESQKIKEHSKIIVPDIESEEVLTKVLDKGITYIGGSLIQININFRKLNKQSKMYIEEYYRKKEKND